MKIKQTLYLLLILFACFSCEKPDENATEPKLSLTPESVDIVPVGDTVEITLTANKNWSASADADWINISKTEGEAIIDNEIIILIIDPNPTIINRTANVTFVCEGVTATAIINQTPATANITFSSVDPKPISSSLIGFNSIYSHYSDSFWATTKIKDALRQMGTHFLRWPGGAPTNRYHWDALNGEGWKDNWDPAYNTADDNPPATFTDLDEHMAICQEVGATPLIGINQGSALKAVEKGWGKTVADGIAEAERLVQYCKTKGYNVNHYYLDNEPYHAGANFKMTWQIYAEQINLYADAIKAINPNAKIVINWQRVQPASLWHILEAAGDNVDIVEIHWYWKHGEATFDTWKNEIPMNTINKWYPQGLTYKEEIKHFYAKCAELGYDHITLGSLEWNVGPIGGTDDSGGDDVVVGGGTHPTKYENTIMQAEMLMQFIDGGLDIATMWPIFWPKLANATDYNANRYLMDPTKNYELSPSVDMFTMFSQAQGKNKYEATSNVKTIYPLVVESEDKNTLIVYTHSKSPTGNWIHFKSPKYATIVYEVLKPTSAIDRATGKKETQQADAVTYNDTEGYYKYFIPAYSLGLLKFTK